MQSRAGGETMDKIIKITIGLFIVILIAFGAVVTYIVVPLYGVSV